MIGRSREPTVFWGTDGARGRRLACERDGRGLDPDGCLVRCLPSRHHTQEIGMRLRPQVGSGGVPDGTQQKKVVKSCARGSIAS